MQDRFLEFWGTLGLPFYLTGGTALGRFYLNHRYSEDLDFFLNASPDFIGHCATINKALPGHFTIDRSKSVIAEDFVRLIIVEGQNFLKIDFVNDIAYHSGTVNKCSWGNLDTPLNILSNKLSALLARDEPKDIIDILHIAFNYAFNWENIFKETTEKTLINEIDVEKRIYEFPLEWLSDVDWFIEQPDFELVRSKLNILAADFMLGKENSLCKGHALPIEKAVVLN
jgi:predicted nucleotidyltransferase component of viral defense system